MSPLRSRILPLVTAVALTTLGAAACSDGDGTSGSDGRNSGGTRHVASEAGDADVPVDPEKVVAIDEPAALNMLSVGVTPDVVFDSWNTTAPVKILEDLGIEVAHTSAMSPEVEEVAQYKPDLIVGTWSPGWSEKGPKYSEVAPMIGGLSQDADGSDIVRAYGTYFDREDEASKVAAALDNLTGDIADSQKGHGKSLSVLTSFAQASGPIFMDGSNSLTASIADTGFTRPEPQTKSTDAGAAMGGWSGMSPEDMKQHDADIVAILAADIYNKDGVTSVPEYAQLKAVKDGHAVDVDGDMWSGGAVFYSYWVLRDLQSFASGDLHPGTTDDALSRWHDFTEAIK